MSYRVIQWSTGNVGGYALRAILQHPELELVGLVVSNPDKVGKDAADLCGLDSPTGIRATDDWQPLLDAGAGAVGKTANIGSVLCIKQIAHIHRGMPVVIKGVFHFYIRAPIIIQNIGRGHGSGRCIKNPFTSIIFRH